MTITIKYQEQFKNETISSYSHWWTNEFGDTASE